MRSLLALLALCAACACAQEQQSKGSGHQPVILIPGVEGSVLDQVNGDRVQVWLPSAEILDNGTAGTFAALRDPWQRISEALVNSLYLRYDPASNTLSEADSGLFAIGNLVGNSTALKALGLEANQKYFQDLIKFLRDEMGYRPGADLWGYPARPGARARATPFRAAAHAPFPRARGAAGRPVTLLVHSMGGLLTLSYFTSHPEAVDELVRQVIFVGTPFLGAPPQPSGGRRLIVHGPGPAPPAAGTDITGQDLFLQKILPVVRNFVYTSPAFYELLPRPGPWPGDGGPPSVVVNVNGQNQTFAGADAAFGALARAAQGNTFTIQGQQVPWPLYPQLRSQADADVAVPAPPPEPALAGPCSGRPPATPAAQRWLRAPLPAEIYTVVGTGKRTKYNATWDNVQRLSDIIGKAGNFEEVDGDETVPLVSAAALDGRARESVRVNANHDDLLAARDSFDAFRKWLTTPPPAPPAAAGMPPAAPPPAPPSPRPRPRPRPRPGLARSFGGGVPTRERAPPPAPAI
eukprot:tig00020903_g15125.t1